VTFFEGSEEIRPWARSNRVGVRTRLTLDHVMASAAIPLFFPPVRLADGFYGDGCVRLVYPMSPAIHMGATRILAISVRAEPPRGPAPAPPPPDARLPLSQIAGVMLNAVFLDSLDTDLERLERINRMLAEVPGGAIQRGDLRLRPLPVLALRPSQDLGTLAEDEYHRFPGMLRYLLKGIGVGPHSGTDLLSYLAFEPIYVGRVMELGYRDTLARRDEIADFLLTPPGERGRVRSA
jgi:NTE family protein